jgi:3-hydroxyisobutyrate dehydrogenase
MHVGFIGTGLMGLPMAERVLAAGYELTAYNRTSSKLEALKVAGAAIVDSPTAVIQAADCTVLMLTNAEAVEAMVLSEQSRQVLTGKTIIQMSTIAPTESRQLHTQIAKAGGDYLEAPVLGSIPEAKAGKLLVMVGSSEAQFEQWSSLLKCFGENPRLLGAVGSAATVKLALNQLIGSLTVAFAASLGLLLREDVAIPPFMEILRQSALYAPTFDKKLQRMLDRDFANPNFPTKHLYKDINLFLTEAERQEIDAPNVSAVQDILAKAMEMGLADADYAALFVAVVSQSE